MIRKAVIPAAGMGTRFLPLAKSQPKAMLPIVDTPVIQIIVQEALDAGLTDVIIITGEHRAVIEKHFTRDKEYEEAVSEKGRLNQLSDLLRVSLFADIRFVRQPILKGLGDAVLCARHLIGNEPFAVLLGDTLVESNPPVLEQLIAAHEKVGGCTVAVEEVPIEKAGRYAVIDAERVGGSLHRIDNIIEKPYPESVPSNLAVAARYVLTPDIFDHLERTGPGRGGEVQLTDALAAMAKDQKAHAVRFEGTRYDIGDKFGFLKTNIEHALRRPELRSRLLAYMENARQRYEGDLTLSAS